MELKRYLSPEGSVSLEFLITRTLHGALSTQYLLVDPTSNLWERKMLKIINT
jgi:hypothetical protein